MKRNPLVWGFPKGSAFNQTKVRQKDARSTFVLSLAGLGRLKGSIGGRKADQINSAFEAMGIHALQSNYGA
jgi:hypothetical protein